MLELDSISKEFRVGTFGGATLQAVNDVSFDVGRGEVVSLIGESGSGKSTIGRMILRLTPTTGGTIRFHGTDISGMERKKLKEYYRSVQGVFQDPFSSFNPVFKVDRVFGVVRQEFYPEVDTDEWNHRIEDALWSVGLSPENCLHKYPHQLSGGQLQRFLIARALLLEIDFLVADEITSMLDASTRIDVLNLLGDLKGTGLSILFITHDLSLGYYLSEHTVILHRGRVVEMGATEKLFANPIHPYTINLLDSVAHLDRKWNDPTVPMSNGAPGSNGKGSGWKLEERCPEDRTSDTHRQDSPRLVRVDDDHQVACHLPSGLETS